MELFMTNEPGRSSEKRSLRGVLIASIQTSKADIQLVNTLEYGEVFIMNNEIQSSAFDQQFYHAKLVGLAVRGDARQIVIFGGGEGCTAQTAFESAPAAHITQYDYDLEAMIWCNHYLHHWNKGVYNNPRLSVIAADAEAVSLQSESADAVIIDLFDYTPDMESFMIKVLQKSASALRPGGRCSAYLGDDTATLRNFICRLQTGTVADSAFPNCKITYSFAYFPSYGDLNSVFLVIERL
jgi:spermidine synthase